MTTAHASTTLMWAVKRGVIDIWRVLPTALGWGAAGSVTLVPIILAISIGAPGWIVALGALPPALAATLMSRFAATAIRGESLSMRVLLRPDPVLAAALAVLPAAAGFLLSAQGAAQQVIGVLAAAVAMLITLPTLAYGALRGRYGLAALRGGLILVLMRPGWAVTLTALAVLLGFAVAATAGVLILVAGPFLLGVAVSVTNAQLEDVDRLQGVA